MQMGYLSGVDILESGTDNYAASQTQDGDYIIIGSSDSYTDVDISNNKGTYDF